MLQVQRDMIKKRAKAVQKSLGWITAQTTLDPNDKDVLDEETQKFFKALHTYSKSGVEVIDELLDVIFELEMEYGFKQNEDTDPIKSMDRYLAAHGINAGQEAVIEDVLRTVRNLEID